jgi:hypothetical protein
MSADKKSRDVAPKKPSAEKKAVEARGVEGKGVEAKAVEAKSSEAKPVEAKPVEAKPAETKAETVVESKPDAAPKKQGMGEGQKPVTQAYKDNWNDIFGKKKKR